MKDQVQGRARQATEHYDRGASERREREGRRRKFIFALKVIPKAARCPFVSRSLTLLPPLSPSACKRIDGVVCMDGVGSRRRRRALNLWTSGSRSERGDGRARGRTRTDHYVEWPGGNMKAKSLSIQPKYQSERRRRTTACLLAYLHNAECFTSVLSTCVVPSESSSSLMVLLPTPTKSQSRNTGLEEHPKHRTKEADNIERAELKWSANFKTLLG